MEAIDVDSQVRAARTWDGQGKGASVPAAVPTFLQRLTVTAQEGVLIGVKWLIVTIIALFGVGWFLGDYAAVRDQARYVAQVRAQQAQQAAQKPGGP